MSKPKALICDLDGTLCNLEHRRHWVLIEPQVGDKVKNRNSVERYIVETVTGLDVGLKLISPNTEPPFRMHVHKDTIKILSRKKRWDKFFEGIPNDTINKQVDLVISNLHANNSIGIIFVSGRPDTYKDVTIKWLERHGYFTDINCKLFMRSANDHRQDSIIKKEIYKTCIEPNYDVQLVLDDRNSVVKMWRKLGLQCWQVADGDF